MITVFTEIDSLPNKVRQSFDAVAQCLGASAPAPLVAAGQRLSQAIDHGEGAGLGNPYHNAQHSCEVLLCAHFLSLWTDLEVNARLEAILAALIHDFHHDGHPNGPTPFRLERQSVNRAMSCLIEAGLPARQRRRIAALVLATEIGHGLAIARACHAYHAGNAPRLVMPVAAPELAELAKSSTATRQALIVCEADVLSSVGLTVEYAIRLQDKLSFEYGVSLEKEDKLRFISEIFPGFIIGTFFQPNVERLRQFLLLHTRDVSATSVDRHETR
ncbi:MAG: hypothetical protein QG599_3571 [Pseudomonadota bacterium]|nr:hypothetical protein [Pseudomonadota bacterium]